MPTAKLKRAYQILALLLLAYLAWPVIRWLLIDAEWRGTERCTGDGACWVFIKLRLYSFMFGFFPEALVWRPILMLLLWGVSLVFLFKSSYRFVLRILPFLITLLPLVSWVLLDGRWLRLAHVETAKWGGLMLSLLLTFAGLCLAFPLGLLLALGRRSELPLIRAASIGYIEFWRGVPLITVLFMSSVMLPLMLPPGFEIDKFLRVLIGVALFTSAYLAEVIRAGLQGVPRGQGEAADALGMGRAQTLFLVTLPQALQAVVPSLMNQVISLFKDTSLVVIVGMFDLLGMVQAASTDPYWLGFATEAYVFAGLVFWAICFAMSRYSLRLEQARGER